MKQGSQKQTCPHAPHGALAQSSLEFLIIFAASIAFFSMLLPQINGARTQSIALATSKAQETALSQLVLAGGEAYSLSQGTALPGRIFLSSNATFSFDSDSSALYVNFTPGAVQKNFSRQATFEARFAFAGEADGESAIFLEKGGHAFTATHSTDGRAVKFVFSKGE